MLNEIKELEQYTYSLDDTTSEPARRLKHGNVCNALSGISRAMTIIARNEIQNNAGSVAIENIINVLKAWCGDITGDFRFLPDSMKREWLPDYIIRILGHPKFEEFAASLEQENQIKKSESYKYISKLFINDNPDIDSIYGTLCMGSFRDKTKRLEILDQAKKLKDLCANEAPKSVKDKYAPVYRILCTLDTLQNRCNKFGFRKSMFTLSLAKPDKNDFKKITYEKIIADAIAQGPLTKYYLVCKKLDIENIEEVRGSKYLNPFTAGKNGSIKWTVPKQKKMDLILKTVAAILLGQIYRNAQSQSGTMNPVNFTDIENWLAGSAKIEEINKYEFQKEKLFPASSLGNAALIGINEKWQEVCNWKVIPEIDLDDYLQKNPGAVFFSDNGAKEYLQENVRYSNDK